MYVLLHYMKTKGCLEISQTFTRDNVMSIGSMISDDRWLRIKTVILSFEQEDGWEGFGHVNYIVKYVTIYQFFRLFKISLSTWHGYWNNLTRRYTNFDVGTVEPGLIVHCCHPTYPFFRSFSRTSGWTYGKEDEATHLVGVLIYQHVM